MFKYNKVSLNIRTTPGKLDFNVTYPKRENNINDPKLKINKKQDKMVIESKPGKIQIDSKQAWAERGLKDYKHLGKSYSSKGHQTALQTIKKIAKNGDQLMNNIAPKAKTLINQIKNEANQNSKKEITLGFAGAPKMRGKAGSLTIKRPRDEIAVDLQLGSVKGNLKWGAVKGYLTQRPDVEVEVQGNLLDTTG